MTFQTAAIQRFLKSLGVRVLTVASSAVVAQLLNDTRTAHYALKILVPVYFQSTCSNKGNSRLGDELVQTNLNVGDEIVVNHRHNLEAVDGTLKPRLCLVVPYGGIGVL